MEFFRQVRLVGGWESIGCVLPLRAFGSSTDSLGTGAARIPSSSEICTYTRTHYEIIRRVSAGAERGGGASLLHCGQDEVRHRHAAITTTASRDFLSQSLAHSPRQSLVWFTLDSRSPRLDVADRNQRSHVIVWTTPECSSDTFPFAVSDINATFVYRRQLQINVTDCWLLPFWEHISFIAAIQKHITSWSCCWEQHYRVTEALSSQDLSFYVTQWLWMSLPLPS